MMDFPPLCVVDANILIDLHIGGLLREFFHVPFRLVAPDVIIAELHDPDGEMLTEHGLQSETLSGAQVQEVASLVACHRRVSANDLFALVLARTLKAMLLTGDRRLRQIADQQGVLNDGGLRGVDSGQNLDIPRNHRVL